MISVSESDRASFLSCFVVHQCSCCVSSELAQPDRQGLQASRDETGPSESPHCNNIPWIFFCMTKELLDLLKIEIQHVTGLPNLL